MYQYVYVIEKKSKNIVCLNCYKYFIGRISNDILTRHPQMSCDDALQIVF